MSVELCQVALWMEALEPGKPFSFLEHHIQCGNSLTGTTPALLAKGIPDEAFAPIEGDDKKLCTIFKKQNKQERQGYGDLFEERYPWERLGNLAAAITELDTLPDDTADDVRAKEDRYRKVVEENNYQTSGKFLADLWCAAFFWRKDRSFEYPITERIFRRVEANPHDVAPWMYEEIQRLRTQYQFFHSHLAFPSVFRPPSKDSAAENEETGWSGGFDCVLGNPPWERVKLQELEFFAARDTTIAEVQNSAARKKLIAALPVTDQGLWEEWCIASREAQGQSHFARNSGRFPLCGKGDINVYALFAEHNWQLLGPRGRAGFIVPSGIATDDTTKDYFQAITKSSSLRSLWEFENVGFFTAGKGHMLRFALTILSGRDDPAEEADFMFQGQAISDLADPTRHFKLNATDIDIINPNTGTCPIFRTKRDALISLKIYQRAGIFWRENDPDGNPWGARFMAMFHMTSDSGLFRTRKELDGAGWELKGNRFAKGGNVMLPLYEAKMAYMYNHRSGTYEHAPPGERPHRLPTPSDEQLADPNYLPLPFYWVADSDVASKFVEAWDRGWILGWRDVTDARASVRTVVACLLGRTAVSNKLPLILTSVSPIVTAALYANLCSFVFDYAGRQKLGGITLNYFIMKQLPILRPQTFSTVATWSLTETVKDWLLPRVLELTYTSWDLQSFAEDCGDDGPPYIWNPDRRLQLQCELDAAFFHLYEIPRDDVAYILDTFPVVLRNDERAYGEFRTKLAILKIYDALARATATGEPYISPLPTPRRAK